MDKKVVRCIFVVYDNEWNGWKCRGPITGRCYTSLHVVFDKSSSFWSVKKEILPDQTDLKNNLQISYYRSNENANAEQGATDNFEQSLFHQPSCEGSETSNEKVPATAQSQMRRSERIWRQNPKYVNATIIEDDSGKEPENFEEATQNLGWTREMRRRLPH